MIISFFLSGSKSMPRMIPIYKPEKLDEQLDEVSDYFNENYFIC